MLMPPITTRKKVLHSTFDQIFQKHINCPNPNICVKSKNEKNLLKTLKSHKKRNGKKMKKKERIRRKKRSFLKVLVLNH